MSPKSVVESILVVSCTKQPLFSVLQQFFSCISSSSLCLTVLDFISSNASYSWSLTPEIQYVVSPTALTQPCWHRQGRAVQGHATRAAWWQCRHPQRSHQLCPPRACRFCMTLHRQDPSSLDTWHKRRELPSSQYQLGTVSITLILPACLLVPPGMG